MTAMGIIPVAMDNTRDGTYTEIRNRFMLKPKSDKNTNHGITLTQRSAERLPAHKRKEGYVQQAMYVAI